MGLLLLLALGGMELAYLWAALAFLDVRAAGGQLHLVWVLPLYAVGVGTSWGLGGLRRPLRYPLAFTGLALAVLVSAYVHFYTSQPLLDPHWLGSLLASFNPVAAQELPAQGVMLAMGLVLVWRGWVLSRTRAGAAACMARFQFGAAIFLMVFLSASLMEMEARAWLPPLYVFMALSLGSLGLARAGGSRGWGPATRLWGGVLAATVLLVMVAGLVVAAWLTPEVLQWPLRAMKALGALLMAAVDWFMNLLPAPGPAPEMPAGMPQGDIAGAEDDVRLLLVMPEWLRRLLRGMLTVLMLGLLLAALASVSAQAWGRLRRGLAGEAEPLPGAFRADLLSWLRGIRRWVLRVLLHRGGMGGVGPLTSPRQVYRSLLRRSARAGWARLPAQTPTEYQAALATALPSGHDDLKAITGAYLRARYGLRPPIPEEGRQVWERWRRLRPLLKRRRLLGEPPTLNIGEGTVGK